RSTGLTLAIAVIGFLAIGAAPSYGWLAGVSILCGVVQGLANPATNRLIMSQAVLGRRGLLTGVKQAGVQAGNFLGGILLPIGAASAMGWRGAVGTAALVPFLGIALLAIVTKA